MRRTLHRFVDSLPVLLAEFFVLVDAGPSLSLDRAKALGNLLLLLFFLGGKLVLVPVRKVGVISQNRAEVVPPGTLGTKQGCQRRRLAFRRRGGREKVALRRSGRSKGSDLSWMMSCEYDLPRLRAAQGKSQLAFEPRQIGSRASGWHRCQDPSALPSSAGALSSQADLVRRDESSPEHSRCLLQVLEAVQRAGEGVQRPAAA